MQRILLAAAALIVLVGCSPATSSVAPASPVAPSIAVTGSPATDPEPSGPPTTAVRRLAGIGRTLDAGRYVYDQAFPHVTLDLPADWFLDQSMPRHFGIRPKDLPVEDTFDVWFDMHLASKDPSCPEEPEDGVGHAASDMASGIANHAGIVATRSARSNVGGLSGTRFDVGIAPSWKAPCPFSDGKPTVPLFVDDDIAGEPAFWGVGGPERIRFIVLDDQHGSNVLITLDSSSGTTLDAIEAAVSPVLQTFAFDVAS